MQAQPRPMPTADQFVITEKTSQARDVRAAVGGRYGPVLPAEGHLIDLLEPEDVVPAWKRWTATLLRPDGLYGTRPASGGNKASKLQAIRDALRTAKRVWLATDCDREGQLIGQEILEHCGYKGEVRRVMFTAQDPQTIRDAFTRARPNGEYARLYAAAVARRQADQIYNLSLTRTATVTLARGARTVIGVAALAQGFAGPLAVKVQDKRQGPPRLHDLPGLQRLCGSRFGRSASKTLEVAQELYDGQGKKVITYPRAETRYLPESLIPDAPGIVAALRAGQAFGQIPMPEPLVIRRGADGTFHDKGLAGVSHHAVIPNANTVGDLKTIWPRLSGDERRLFDVVARSYLAALMPDYRYRQTTVTLDVHGHVFLASGRQPIEAGWRAAFPDWRPAEERGEDAQPLPVLRHGETARLTDAAVEDKETRPPPRYNEGTLVEAMQNVWRFVADGPLWERLREAKGIGTPATRAEVIRGLKAQEFLALDGKHIVPTERGLALFGVLERADPALVDPGVTAQLELLLDEVLVGTQEMAGAVDAVCAQALRIIDRLTDGVGAQALPPTGDAPSRGKTTRGRVVGTGTLPPTEAMRRYVVSLSQQKGIAPPAGYANSSAVCRAFLDQYAPREGRAGGGTALPTAAWPAADEPIPQQPGAGGPGTGVADGQASSVPPRNRKGRGPAGNTRKTRPARRRTMLWPVVQDRPRAGSGAAARPEASGTPLRIPFGNKEAAQKLGARYGASGWYAPPGVALDPFRKRGWM